MRFSFEWGFYRMLKKEKVVDVDDCFMARIYCESLDLGFTCC